MSKPGKQGFKIPSVMEGRTLGSHHVHDPVYCPRRNGSHFGSPKHLLEDALEP